MNDNIKVVVSSLITGIIILFFYVFVNKLEILWSSYAFLLLGLLMSLIDSFGKVYFMVACILMIFIISFNIYITVVFKNKIEENKVPNSYGTFSVSSIILILLQLYIVINNLIKKETNFDKLKLLQLCFLITLSFIISITQMIILKSFSTDG